MTNVLKCNKCNIVIDELLAYVQNKISVIDKETLVRLCTSSFSSEDIKKSKSLLFDSVPSDYRKIFRKNKGKEERDLADIINLFKSVEPTIIPVFTARQLEKLPPLTWNNLDCTKVLKDLQRLQTELDEVKKIYATNEQLQDLKKDLLKLEHDSLPPTSVCNVNLRRGAWVMDSTPMGASHRHNCTANDSYSSKESPDCINKSHIYNHAEKRVLAEQNTCESTPIQRLSAVTKPTVASGETSDTGSVPRVTSPIQHSLARNVTQPQPANSDNSVNAKARDTRSDVTKEAVIKPRFDDNDNSPWIPVTNRKKKKYRYLGKSGIARDLDSNFRAASKKVPVFITNVHKDTNENDIVKYVQTRTSETIALQKIDTLKWKDHKAYKFFVSEAKLSMYLDKQLWPKGIIFRRFVNFKYRRSNTKSMSVNGLSKHNNE